MNYQKLRGHFVQIISSFYFLTTVDVVPESFCFDISHIPPAFILKTIKGLDIGFVHLSHNMIFGTAYSYYTATNNHLF